MYIFLKNDKVKRVQPVLKQIVGHHFASLDLYSCKSFNSLKTLTPAQKLHSSLSIPFPLNHDLNLLLFEGYNSLSEKLNS